MDQYNIDEIWTALRRIAHAVESIAKSQNPAFKTESEQLEEARAARNLNMDDLRRQALTFDPERDDDNS